MLRRLGIAVTALAVLSCTAGKPPPAEPPSEARTFPQTDSGAPTTAAPAPGVAAPTISLPAIGTYRIDSSQSELRLLVYRTGALANFGHNHVILNRSVNGSIDVGASVAACSFTLSAAVAGFIVDESRARLEEGEDFATDVSEGAKSGTWNNMTGPSVLNATLYPVIMVRSVRVEMLQGKPTATMLVSVAGRDSTVMLPFDLQIEPYGILVTASFELNQSTVGLTPFSLMLGALAVRDTMVVKLKVIAQFNQPRQS